MLFFLVTGISFIIFIKSLSLKSSPQWVSGLSFSPLPIWKELSVTISTAITRKLSISILKFPMKQSSPSSKHVKGQERDELSVLDLPELALECIIEKLSPAGLCTMTGVCSSLRERCTSDYFWEKHLKEKWGGIIGPMAYREWQSFIASRKSLNPSEGLKRQGWIKYICSAWPIQYLGSKLDNSCKEKRDLAVDSIMSWYLALETGRFWFPAQVFNRENGHVGFMLSCYDAELRYDHQTNTFQARYPPHGRRAMAIESRVQWDRIRAPPVDTCPHDLHISDCLSDLRPGDHIEIQWRRSKEFPYGWWYGVVGHLELCDGNNRQHCQCHCHRSDTVVLEFKQYNPGSRWRRASVSRKEHIEEGNEADGFYGGIRKLLHDSDEISRWKKLWPYEVLE